jgi:hypothetical protein
MKHLGFFNYFRELIPKYSTLMAPIEKLRYLKQVNWTPALQKIYDQVNQILSSELVLSYPNLNEEFMVATDASNHGIGAVLYQEYEKKIHYICFMSREQHIKLGSKDAGIPRMGRSDPIEVSIGDKRLHHKFEVLKLNEDCGCIFGMDIFPKAGISISGIPTTFPLNETRMTEKIDQVSIEKVPEVVDITPFKLTELSEITLMVDSTNKSDKNYLTLYTMTEELDQVSIEKVPEVVDITPFKHTELSEISLLLDSINKSDKNYMSLYTTLFTYSNSWSYCIPSWIKMRS